MATDIAARGIDIDELKFVINFELSDVSETYVHRIGRTGRAGAEGTSISFVDGLDLLNLKNTEKLIGKKIPVIKDHPFHTDDLIAQKRDSNNKPVPSGGSEKPKSSNGNGSRSNNNRKKPSSPAASVGYKKPKNKNFTRKNKRKSFSVLGNFFCYMIFNLFSIFIQVIPQSKAISDDSKR